VDRQGRIVNGPGPEVADGWFTEQIARHQGMTRDELLREAKVLAFNYHQRAVLAEAYRTGSEWQLRQLRRPLARAWELLDWRRKTVRMEDLRRAIDLEWAEEQDALAAQRAYDEAAAL
jgi:hypothetical protein